MKKKTVMICSSALLFLACGTDDEETQEESSEIEAPDESNQVEEEDPSEEPNNNEDETESEDENEGDNETSEGTDKEAAFDEAEMREYLISLTEDPENVDERALEQLELRGLHANTYLYEGRMDPNNQAYYSMPDGDGGHDEERIAIEPNEEGYFTLEFPVGMATVHMLEEGETLRFAVELPEEGTEEVFYLPIHESQEGMEVIHSHTAPMELKEELASAYEWNPIYETGRLYIQQFEDRSLSPMGYEIDGVFYESDELFGDGEEGPGTTVNYFPDDPTPGQHYRFHVPMDGYIALMDIEAKELDEQAQQAADQIEEATVLPEGFSQDYLEQGEESYEYVTTGQTVPNAWVLLSIEEEEEYPVLRHAQADENGDFELTFVSPFPSQGQTLHLTIIDEAGYPFTYEIEVE